ncbi:hypothetical protein Tco_0184174 [Tanacetum coccineum]
MIRSLMYLTSSRLVLVQAVCYCAHYQARPAKKHLKKVKRIFRYLKETINIGLWYPKDSGSELTAFLDVDHARCLDTRKSTYRRIQFLGEKLVSWMSKKKDCTAMSTTEVEYIALSANCAQVMWMRTHLKDYGFDYNKTVVHRLLVSHSNLMQPRATLSYQAHQCSLPLHQGTCRTRFEYLVRQLGMRCLSPAELEVLEKETD